MAALRRFVDAQEQSFGGFADALAELRSGQKRGHWIWYILPQLAGLGLSPTSVLYGIADIDEAMAYLRDPVLRARLTAVTSTVADRLRGGSTLSTLMGSGIDVVKLASSLTRFEGVARRLQATDDHEACREFAEAAGAVLAAAAAAGHPRCRFTLDRLETRP